MRFFDDVGLQQFHVHKCCADELGYGREGQRVGSDVEMGGTVAEAPWEFTNPRLEIIHQTLLLLGFC